MLRSHLTRTRLGMVLAVIAGAVLGAVFGQPGSSRAASTAAPIEQDAPDDLRDAEGGQTLTAAHGTWTGARRPSPSPWSRCDTTGSACVGYLAARPPRSTRSPNGRRPHAPRDRDGAERRPARGTRRRPPRRSCPRAGARPAPALIQIATLAPPARLEISSASVSPGDHAFDRTR